jgi:hypothetical protein
MEIRRLTVAVTIAAALAGCQQQDAAQPAPDANVADASTAPAATSGNLWNGGTAKPLDIQVAHPNGTVLQLTSLQSRATDTAVGVRVINGRERDVDLNRFNNNRDGYILLDTGERLYLSPPATNTKLTIPANQTFEGELVFLGRLPAARSAILVLNENSSDSEYTTTPQFRVDLPLTAPAGAAQ